MGSSQTILPYLLTSECKEVCLSGRGGGGGGNITNCIATSIQDIASSVFLLGFSITNLIQSHAILLIHQFKFKNGLGWATFFRISKSVVYAGAVFQAELYFSRASLKKKTSTKKTVPCREQVRCRMYVWRIGKQTSHSKLRFPTPFPHGGRI